MSVYMNTKVLSILVWKNIITKKHRLVFWIIEVAIVIFCLLFFTYSRSNVSKSKYVPEQFEPINLKSMVEALNNRSAMSLRLAANEVNLKKAVENGLNFQQRVTKNEVSVVLEGRRVFITMPEISGAGCLNTAGWKFGEHFALPPKTTPRCLAKTVHNVGDMSKGAEPNYIHAGYLVMQWNSHCAVIGKSVCTSLYNQENILFQRYPSSRNVVDDTYSEVFVYPYLPFMLMAIYLLPFINMIYSITYEKQHNINEYLWLNGVSFGLQRLAWIISTAFDIFAMVIPTLLLLFVFDWDKSFIFRHVSVSVMLWFLLGYMLATLSFASVVGALTNNVSAATASGIVLHVLQMLPAFFLKFEIMQLPTRLIFLFLCLPNTALAIGCWVAVSFEAAERPLTMATQFEGMKIWKSQLSFAWPSFMLFAQALVYFGLAWLIEGASLGRRIAKLLRKKQAPPDQNQTDKAKSTMDFHSPDVPAVRLQAVFKSYGVTPVLRDVNMVAFKNQITVIVGHNAAGKTTLLKLLTGRERPSSGNVLVHQTVVKKNAQRARIGYCKQETQIYPLLTVEEHLLLFARVRSAFGVRQENAVATTLETLNLTRHKDEVVGRLSADARRLVSIGVAIIGQPKLIVLDEPTLHMDEETRYKVWELLRKLKLMRDTALIISTNRMDEADALADNVIVMANGTVQASGSLQSLRLKYSPGYRLFVVCDKTLSGAGVAEQSWHEVEEILRFYLPNLTDDQRMRNPERRYYYVPSDALGWFSELMVKLEQLQAAQKISYFGTMLTKMEDIFMTISHYGSQYNPLLTTKFSTAVSMVTKPANMYTSRRLDRMDTGLSIPKYCLEVRYHSPTTKFFLQAYMTFLMRLRFSQRHLTITFMQFIMPLAITAAFVLVPHLFGYFNRVAMQLTVAQYAPSDVFYATSTAGKDPHNPNEISSFVKAIKDSWSLLDPHANVNFHRVASREQESGANAVKRHLMQNRARVFDSSFVSFALDQSSSDLRVTMFFNDVSYHAAPIAMNLLINAIAQLAHGHKGEMLSKDAHLSFVTKAFDGRDNVQNDNRHLVVVLMLAIICFLCAPMMMIIVDDAAQVRMQQQLAGISRMHYWLIAVVYDYALYLCLLAVILPVLHATDQLLALQYAACILTLYGLTALSVNYLLSLCFRFASAAYVCTLLWHIMCAIVGTCGFSNNPHLLGSSFNLLIVSVAPSACAAFALLRLPCTTKFKPECLENKGSNCIPEVSGYDFYTDFSFHISILAVQCFVSCALLLIIDCRLLQLLYYILVSKRQSKMKNSPAACVVGMEWRQSEEVENEKRFIENNFARLLSRRDLLILRNITKLYRLVSMTPLTAVDRVCALVERGSTFCVLGASGSGKSTLLGMILGSISMSTGDCYIKGKSVRRHYDACRKLISYCPQDDALPDYMTGFELLIYYVRLRGVVQQHAERLAWLYIDMLLLRENATRLIRYYSGGTRRKLQIAVALIGHSDYVLLDDPTVQIDAFSRRRVWSTLEKFRETLKNTIVLSTSAADECLRLSSNIMLLSNGKVIDLGTIDSLNEKYANTYNLEILFKRGSAADELSAENVATQAVLPQAFEKKTATLDSASQRLSGNDDKLGNYDREDVVHFVESFLPGIQILSARNDCLHCLLSRRLADGRIFKLSDLFQRLTAMQSRFKIVECGVMQSSVELIYKNLTKEQRGHFSKEKTALAGLQNTLYGGLRNLFSSE